jgi:hypothetical protein
LAYERAERERAAVEAMPSRSAASDDDTSLAHVSPGTLKVGKKRAGGWVRKMTRPAQVYTRASAAKHREALQASAALYTHKYVFELIFFGFPPPGRTNASS